jgi:hypothetical protein
MEMGESLRNNLMSLLGILSTSFEKRCSLKE